MWHLKEVATGTLCGGKTIGFDVVYVKITGQTKATANATFDLKGGLQVTFPVTPRDTWWWDQSPGGWSQTAGTYQVYVGDSSATANLPLRGSFRMTSTSAARQAVVTAPRTIAPGQQVTVRVRLTASGNATPRGVRFSLQAPQGRQEHPVGSPVFGTVTPSEAPIVTFTVQPPAWAPATKPVLYATVGLGGQAQRQGGATVRVSR